MVVYVESNFVLEIALRQRQAPAAEAILALAEQDILRLAIPSVALVEPYSKLGYRHDKRQGLLNSWTATLREAQEIGLPAAQQGVVREFRQLLMDSANLVQQEYESLQAVVDRIVAKSAILELNASTLGQASLYRNEYGLDHIDSLIYAAIIADLRQGLSLGPSCFVSRDKSGFALSDISAELASYQSRYISTFSNGLTFIHSALDQQGVAPTPESPK